MAYDIRIWRFATYRDASREGEGKGEKREKSAYHVTSNMSRCREEVVVVQRHRRTYHVTPDLRWHEQQLPYSSLLHVFTEYSTSVDGILPHKLLETILSVSLRISTY